MNIPAIIVIPKAPIFPIVDILLIIVRSLVPIKFIINKTTIKVMKPIVTFFISDESFPKIERAVFTTPVAKTPQAILAETTLVIPT